MCTAVSVEGLFGRTLDVDAGYGEEAVILPRRYRLGFMYEGSITEHCAVIGTALVKDGVPLWFDAVNEYGLGAAGLNFPDHAVYHAAKEGKRNLASFELIPFLLCNCRSTDEAEVLLREVNITPDAVSHDLPPTPMHWMISDRESSLVAEPMADGLKVYGNPFGVLTNAPPFPVHCESAMSLSDETSELAGDWASESRFKRALFAKRHTAGSGVSDFFHVMDTVKVPKGCGRDDWYTVYTSCADLASGDYYFATYENRRIRKVSLADAELDSDTPVSFSMRGGEDIKYCNNR